MQAEKRELIRATIPVPDHSDLRGFTYRAPTNIQGYNDTPPNSREGARLKGQLYHRKGFWTSIADFFRGKKEPSERPMSPELVNSQLGASGPTLSSSDANRPANDRSFGVRQARPLPQEGDSSNLWPG